MTAVRIETIGSATLYLGDAQEILPTVIGIGAIVSDPPYGIGFVHGGGGRRIAGKLYNTRFANRGIIGDDRKFDPDWLLERYKSLPIALFGGNHFASRLPDSSCWLVWDKREGRTRNTMADCELVWTNRPGVSRLKSHLRNGMFKASEHGEARAHPMQKPVAVMAWVLEELLIPRLTLVADPYMGSGTAGIAALRRARRFVGVEIDPEFFDAACRRIELAQRQAELFPGGGP